MENIGQQTQDKANDTKETIFKRYFIPPQTVRWSKWGQAFMVFILFGLMLIGILFCLYLC